MLGVIVCGAEHSGTRFVWALMELHPHIKAAHLSFPSGGRFYPVNTVVENKKFWGDIKDFVFLYVVRDKWCNLKSQERESSLNAEDAVVLSDEFFIEEMKRLNHKFLFVSYETVVRFRDRYLRQIFENINVNPYEFDYDYEGDMDIGYSGKISVIPKDGNEKYIK